MTRKARLLVSGVTILGAVAGFTAFEALRPTLRKMDTEAAIRIVHSAAGNGGVLMAIDEVGLQYVSELYALPKTCTKENYTAADKSIQEKLFLCEKPRQQLIPQMIRKGTVLIAEQTKGIFLRRSFLLPNRHLVAPYAANSFDMARDGVIEVEKVRITEGPNRDLEGWIETSLLTRLCCPSL